MKKTLLVAVIALTVLFALATTAFAATSPTGNYTAATGDNPHAGFAAGATNCSVCHSVHNAAGASPYDAANAENLLRSSRADACTYCHITGGISTLTPYGTGAAGTTAYTVDTANNHSSALGATCVACHAVHGANTFTTTGNILKNTGTNNTTFTVAAAAASDETIFCAQCHLYFDAQYDDAANTTPNHVMIANSTAFPNGSAGTNIAVASASSVYCTSCHNNTVATASSNFPHLTDTARFLSNTGGTTEAAAGTDGPCLGCHANAGVTF